MHPLALALAQAWLCGPWTLDGIRQRCRRLLQRRRLSQSLEGMTLGFWLELRDRPQLRRSQPLAAAIEAHTAFRHIAQMPSLGQVLDATEMAAAPQDWPLPELPTLAALAGWLPLQAAELEWLADPWDIARHYRRYWRGQRLIEAPRRRLRNAQRQVARQLLAHVPSHDAAHGFCRGRSVLSAVQAHAGQELLLVTDLRAFFPSVRSARVHAMFQRLGYPEPVAQKLTQLCTTRCHRPPRPRAPLPAGTTERYRGRHLPQGAPSSPGLANLCAFHLDARLSGLAASYGARYSRYADDLIFSGGTGIGTARFLRVLEQVVLAEGFVCHPHKTRIMRRSQRQQVLGIVLNETPSLPRPQLERLEAELFNHVRDGLPQSPGVDSPRLLQQLTGRVAWARQVNPQRARRVCELLAALQERPQLPGRVR